MSQMKCASIYVYVMIGERVGEGIVDERSKGKEFTCFKNI